MNSYNDFGKTELACFIFLVCNSIAVIGQSIKFKTLRYEEDYSAVHSDSLSPSYSGIKYLDLGQQFYLSVGGDARYQYFKIENEDWGETPASSDGFFLKRRLIHGSLQAGKHWRAFGQLQSGVAVGKQVVSPVDENGLELHQIFVDYKFSLNGVPKGIVRLGRQEIAYGSQRLVSVRNGPNTRQSFDGITSRIHLPQTKVDFFIHHAVRSKRGILNDHFRSDTRIWGSYLTVANSFFRNIDLYYIGLQKPYSQLDDGIGREQRHSFGARLWNLSGKLKYDIESVFQSGTLADSRIGAWTISIHMAYTFDTLKLAPQLSMKTEIISGDKRYDDHKINTFNPLFPSGAYFGLAALFGPSNLFDIHPSISLSLSRKLIWSLDYDAFWRLERSDGIYTNNNLLIYTGRGNPYKFMGQQFSMDFLYSICSFASAKADIKWFDAGEFLKAAGEGKDILFFAFTIQGIF